ncbi:MAG: hypothetical protein IT183_02370, partial [Acidobacteria bacterium]|nr:hypothetical protein [Acidobacteriota bacterium]
MRRLLTAAALMLWTSTVVWAAMGTVSDAPQAPAAPAGRSVQPLDTAMFALSQECVACHNNLTSPTGEDVSIGANWRGSIMANSARDPYFHASVRRETIDHPTKAAEIEDECAACHMPTAQKIAHAAGAKGQVFAHLPIGATEEDSDLDRLAADGITCTVCHQIAPDGLGTRDRFNGNFALAAPLATGRRPIFGPFAVDAGRKRIMHSVSGFEQVEAPHIRQSELCATCHTLITEAYGPDGTVIGSLPEQMNYQEWRHSAFDEEQKSCQSCHLPLVQGPVRAASVLGEYRDSLSRHTFLGGNAFMLRLMNRYRVELGVEATPAELEATARATVRQLERDTATVMLDRVERTGGRLAFDVVVTNLTGHKFPTGYPSRRTWLHVTVRNAEGGVVFESGRMTDMGLIDGNASDTDAQGFEPHYEEITAADQVQIYESIMGSLAGTPTTGLLQATQYLKDNRLLPRGFDKASAPAEIAVFGRASGDADFGAAGDRVRYRIPATAAGPLAVEVELRYQPIGYRWAQNLASYKAPEPQRFVSYFNS